MMEEAWQGRYGDTLSQTDPMFWASKLHFSLSSAQFYNFPYAFGYLFSLGVVATREKQVCCSTYPLCC
jgi:oligoendopeptidase F